MIQVKFNDKAKQVLADTLDLSGSIVVTELPEVGDEHVVYELREKKVLQSLVTMYNQQMDDDGVQYDGEYTFVFNTSKEMQETFNSITPDENYPGDIYLNYITEEDNLIGAEYTHGAWKFTEAVKVSDCKFDVSYIFELEDNEYVVILKEYLGIPEGEEEAWYTGRLWNDELYTFERIVRGILLGTPTVGVMTQTECEENLKELPPDTPSDKVFENIPYEKIINYQLTDNLWYFTPKSEEVTVTSYWIYTNNEWVNIDNIESPTDYVAMVFSSRGYSTAPIPLNKIHIYLDDSTTQLTIVPVDFPEETVVYGGYIYIQKDKDITTNHTFKLILDNDVTFGDLGARVSLEGFWGGTSFSPVIQETFTAITTGGLGTLILINESDNPK